MIKTLECTITLQDAKLLVIKVQYNSGREHGNRLVLEVIEMLQTIWVQEAEHSNIEQFGISSSVEMTTVGFSAGSTELVTPQPLVHQALLSDLVSQVMSFFTLDSDSESPVCHILGAAELVVA